MQTLTPEQKLKQVKANCDVLVLTFNTLQGMIREIQASKDPLENCNGFTLAAASKIVQSRWEREKRDTSYIPEQKIEPPPVYTVPPEIQKEIPKVIQDSAFFRTVWGNRFRSGE